MALATTESFKFDNLVFSLASSFSYWTFSKASVFASVTFLSCSIFSVSFLKSSTDFCSRDLSAFILLKVA
tara:strand:- start:2142 stop:2351 length:210 start_codon:yes stop_codon:yes gene_type:complete